MKTKKQNIKAGDWVKYAGSLWMVACIKKFPHGKMIGIYDEPPSDHIDYLNPESVKLVLSARNK